MATTPEHLEIVGDFLAVRWNDRTESVVSLEGMRRHCPCAQCAGEPDVTGAVRRPLASPSLRAESFEVRSLERIGSYAVAVEWGDGHRTGIYSWSLLRSLADDPED